MKQVPLWSSFLQTFQVFFPSWKFYEKPGAIPQLQVRYKSLEKDYSHWHCPWTPHKRKWFHLFYNPWGQLQLFHYTLLFRLLDEIQNHTGTDVEFLDQSRVYPQILSAIRSYCSTQKTDVETFQMRLFVRSPDAIDSESTALVFATTESMR